MPLSSSSAAATEFFDEADRGALALIAFIAVQCTDSRTAEVVMDFAIAPPKTPQEAATSLPSLLSQSANPLCTHYPEMRVLLHCHRLRSALRDLQECPLHARRGFLSMVQVQLASLAGVLPDPLFVAVGTVLHDRLADTSEDGLSKEACHVLEVQLLRVVEATQTELLRSTKMLTQRSGTLTLRFHHIIPFV